MDSLMWWLVGSLIFAVGIGVILIVVGGSKLSDRHPTNRYLP